jgi:hypothetical protein
MIPYVGPLLVWLGDGLFKHMKSQQFADDTYVVVKNAAIATWDGIKQNVKGLVKGFANREKATAN